MKPNIKKNTSYVFQNNFDFRRVNLIFNFRNRIFFYNFYINILNTKKTIHFFALSTLIFIEMK